MYWYGEKFMVVWSTDRESENTDDKNQHIYVEDENVAHSVAHDLDDRPDTFGVAVFKRHEKQDEKS